MKSILPFFALAFAVPAMAQDQTAGTHAGAASVIATGGTAVVIVNGPVKGCYVTNPINAAGQGIATAENAYLDSVGTPGSTDAGGSGTTVILQPGQSYSCPPFANGIKLRANAATTSHALTVVQW